MHVSKVVTLALSVVFAATLAAAPQDKKAAPAKSATKTAEKAPEQKAEKKAAAKGEAVKAADLPKAVTDAVMKAHKDATIDSATKSMRGMNTVYMVKYMDKGKKDAASMNVTLNDKGEVVTAPAKKGKGK